MILNKSNSIPYFLWTALASTYSLGVAGFPNEKAIQIAATMKVYHNGKRYADILMMIIVGIIPLINCAKMNAATNRKAMPDKILIFFTFFLLR